MLKLRIISAIVMITVFLLCFFVLPPIYFSVFIFLISLIMIYELFNLLRDIWFIRDFDQYERKRLILGNTQKKLYLLFSILGLIFVFAENNIYTEGSVIFFIYIGILFWTYNLYYLLKGESLKSLYKNKESIFPFFPIDSIYLPSLFAVFHILPMISAIIFLFSASKTYLFFVFLIIWIADIGAYFTGKSFGKVQIAKNISPGKTAEGVMGGICLNVTFILIISLIFSDFDLIGGIIFAIIITLLSVYGDLYESWLKRSAGLKDSSNFIPGHGGFLDRFDSFLPSLPVAALLYYYNLINFTI
tara:strand:+ start:39166 stop:40071 length:906 start_codon:yes stop_codon:yes gene_type:complete